MRRRSSLRRLSGSVVVLTGASSGAGRAIAEAFAECGASLVLAARTEQALQSLADECRAKGVEATPVVTDVGDARQVRALAARAVSEHGRIDTWVNCAGVLLAGAAGDETFDEIHRLIQTNVAGAAFGAHVAMERFREQGHGVLIDVSSLLGVVPNPLVPFYVMSKFAVRGLSLSLHHAKGLWPDIHACVVLPGPIDTPLFERAANHTGRVLRAIPPPAAPERIAAGVVSCARRPRRQMTVGVVPHLILMAHWFAPRITEWIVARAAAGLLVRSEPAPETSGAVFDGQAQGRVGGGWRWLRARASIGSALGRRSWRRQCAVADRDRAPARPGAVSC